MKKSFSIVLFLILTTCVFAISYKDNTYQKLADEYSKKAQLALDAGEYDEATEYSKKAEENAELSKAFIQQMMVRSSAEDAINMAKNQLKWAESIDAQNTFPMAYTAAKDNLSNAEGAFEAEEFEKAKEFAELCLASLDGVKEVIPLPAVYIVRPWAETKDCFWNISGRPYIYNNPLLWENLYQANKNKLPDPANPNLIRPGMKMDIPSITGEFRSGTYDPKKQYEAYGN